ncbi:hypothetical protein MMC17_000395 [Xylographa soralifera]|nr:hypothetical protein [Xylographa soralifera]
MPQKVEVNTTGITVLASGGSSPSVEFVYFRNHTHTYIHTYETNEIARSIVFIHGLQGYPRDTWAKVVDSKTYTRHTSNPLRISSKLSLISRSRNASQEIAAVMPKDTFWPEDLLSVDLPEARVMTYGYDSHVSRFFNGPANQNNIMTHGEDLLHRLAGKRSSTYGRRIIFIVHSLGGIVLKEALRRSRGAMDQDSDLQDIYDSTFAIIFFGTPHRGSDYLNIGLTAANAARAAGLDVNRQVLRTLAPSNDYLRLLREEFSTMLESRHWLVDSFQEAYGFRNIVGLHGKVTTLVS